MNLLGRYRRLRGLGVLGMNGRNTACILDRNPRRCFPLVDGKRQMRDLCRAIGVPTPDLYAVLAAHAALRHLPRLLERHADFVLKPNRGAGGRGVLVLVGRDGEALVRRDRLLDRHPDTGASVVGFPVPHWPAILEIARRVSRATGLGYVGVDVVLDRRHGPMLLEANARPGLAIQIANGRGLWPRFAEID